MSAIAIEWIALSSLKRVGFYIDLGTVLEWCHYMDNVDYKQSVVSIKRFVHNYLADDAKYQNGFQEGVDYIIIDHKRNNYNVLLTDDCFKKILIIINIHKPYHVTAIIEEVITITNSILNNATEYSKYQSLINDCMRDINMDKSSIYWSGNDKQHFNNQVVPHQKQRGVDNNALLNYIDAVDPLDLSMGIIQDKAINTDDVISTEYQLLKKIFMKALYIIVLEPDMINEKMSHEEDGVGIYADRCDIIYDRSQFRVPYAMDNTMIYCKITKKQPPNMAYTAKFYYKNEHHFNLVKDAIAHYKINERIYLISMMDISNVLSKTFIDMH